MFLKNTMTILHSDMPQARYDIIIAFVERIVKNKMIDK